MTQIVFCKEIQRPGGALYGFYAPNCSLGQGGVFERLQGLLDDHMAVRHDGSAPRSGSVEEVVATLRDGRVVPIRRGETLTDIAKLVAKCTLRPAIRL